MKLSILAIVGMLSVLTSAVLGPVNLSTICKLEVEGVHGAVRDDIDCGDCEDAYTVCAAELPEDDDTKFVCEWLTCRNGGNTCSTCGYKNCNV